jgi:hypothetical protein
MKFEINRQRIDDFKVKSNYRKSQVSSGISMIVWGRWIKDMNSPTIRSLESVTENNGLNPAELAIAILELRQEYKEKVNAA